MLMLVVVVFTPTVTWF